MTPIDWPTRDLLAHRVDATPQRTALVDVATDESWSYREFDDRVDAVASTLEATGLGRGDRLGVLMDTRPAFAVVCFAALRLGVTVVPLNVRETEPELVSKADRTTLTALVCERDTEAVALDVADAADASCYSVDDPDADRTQPVSIAPKREQSVDPVDVTRDTEAVIMFTSGTSGEPKGVRLTIGNLVASATASAFRLGVDPDDRWLCCLPMYHMGGLAPVLRSTLYGTTVVVQRAFDAESTARVIDARAVTGVSLVPTMVTRLLEAGWQPPESLRSVLLGGAPASSELLERCRERSVPVYPTYGMTETASQIATATPEETQQYPGTVGQPLAFTDVSVVDDDGSPVESGERGELVVSGPTVTPGYLESDHTTAAFTDRGLRTGDIGHRDQDGYLWISNRRSDRIVTGGENVDPGEVIEALCTHSRVEAAAVVGLPDEEWGERVAAVVVFDSSPNTGDSNAGATNGASETADDGLAVASLLAHCDGRLAGFKQPKTVAVTDALPRTASGTVDRDAVRALLSERGVDVSELR
nr:o-succinylbenzoate--CoA ligase [Natrarchaeobaculum sulfurireducens]